MVPGHDPEPVLQVTPQELHTSAQKKTRRTSQKDATPAFQEREDGFACRWEGDPIRAAYRRVATKSHHVLRYSTTMRRPAARDDWHRRGAQESPGERASPGGEVLEKQRASKQQEQEATPTKTVKELVGGSFQLEAHSPPIARYHCANSAERHY